MRLQKIAPEDFVFSNEIISNTCWRNPDGTFDDSPSFSSISFTNGNPNASISNNLTVKENINRLKIDVNNFLLNDVLTLEFLRYRLYISFNYRIKFFLYKNTQLFLKIII